MQARLGVATVLLALAGCGSGDTTVFIDLALGSDTPPPDVITVSVFDVRERIAQKQLSQVTLPGSILLRGLPAEAETLRINLYGQGATASGAGSAVVATQPDSDVRTQLVMLSAFSDVDGDTVLDAIDDCPTVANADQTDTDGDGTGDACDEAPSDAGVDDQYPPPTIPDLLQADLPHIANGCPPASGLFFCEDFNSGVLASKWSVATAGTTVAVDTTLAHSGKYALHIVVPATTAPSSDVQGTIENTSSFVMNFPATGTAWVRAYFFVEGAYPATVELMQISQPSSPFHYYSLQAPGGHPALGSDIPAIPYAESTSVTLPIGAWTCIESELVVSHTGSVDFNFDGVQASDASLTGNFAPSPTFGRLRIGFRVPGGSVSQIAPTSVWVDDIAMEHNGRVGCP